MIDCQTQDDRTLWRNVSKNHKDNGTFSNNMGGCQNYGPLLGPLNTRRRIILRNHKRTIILTTTHMGDVALWDSLLRSESLSCVVETVRPA